MRRKRAAQRALETPRAAGLAGVVFALLLAAAIVLIRLGMPQGAGAVTAQAFTNSERRDSLQSALALVPFAGIFFLWFMATIRAHVGAAEDRFLATVFLGSGLVFTATLFGAAAAAGAVLSVPHPAGTAPAPAYWDFGRHFAYTMMVGYGMRMAAVFVSVVSAIGHRLGVLPRFLTALGLLTALTLLFAASNVPWSELVFPGWSLVLSLYILVASGRPRSRPAPRA
ncbi:hypothetical protein SRB17_51410 [Streptomyces sp. RB17]|uniref:hypothetical protein n=1 Tax=Streptomyces sp. RB17 TaxID=2585197 RepID=UPI001297C4CF|nr:hypothetical protein [Streptomyces sp. RB17]MQY37137.1 hypothetical protein [Streptomyces sp. RB17]